MSKQATILIVDDEVQIRRALKTNLVASGYSVMEARDGESALAQMREGLPDLILLDINMPGIGGLEACREIRESCDVPIIMLSVRSSERDKVRALDAGADDYVVKPFGIQELQARIRAALRRYDVKDEPQAEFNSRDLSVDFVRRAVIVRGQPVRLTPKEFELLRQLVLHRGKPLSHRSLLQAVWGPDYGEETDYLRVFINQLRKKIELDTAKPVHILTVPWVGYQFEPGE